MDISAALAADLAALTQALDAPDIDLQTQVQALTADLRVAVASYLGLRMTIALDGHDVSFTVTQDPRAKRDVGTSLLIPLVALTATDAGSTLVLYAGAPGAFVDLAADLSYALGIEHSTLILDGHLGPVVDGTGVTGLQGHSAINQALGVLIEAGHTPESARAELHRVADADHGDLHRAAAQIVHGTRQSAEDEH